VSVKTFKSNLENVNREYYHRFFEEIHNTHVLSGGAHENLLPILAIYRNVAIPSGSSSSNPSMLDWVLVFPKYDCNLEEYVQNNALTTYQLMLIAVEAAKGLKEIHDKKFIHRDIRPSNFLVKEIPTFSEQRCCVKVVLSEFGIVTGQNYAMTSLDNLFYTDPIALRKKVALVGYSNIVDIFSFGQVLAFLFSNDRKNLVSRKCQPIFPPQLPSLQKLYEDCVSIEGEGEKRPNATTILNTLGEMAAFKECVICLDKPRTVQFKNCNHFALCKECWEGLPMKENQRFCPCCNSLINEAITVGELDFKNTFPIAMLKIK